jgi:hypothetical protein
LSITSRLPATGFPRRPLLGSSVNSPWWYRGKEATAPNPTLGRCAGILTVAPWRWWKTRRGENVRILVTFSMNPEKGDQLIKEGRIGETMGSILDELQPEAAYFTRWVLGRQYGRCLPDTCYYRTSVLASRCNRSYAARDDPRRPEGGSWGGARANGTKIRLEPS